MGDLLPLEGALRRERPESEPAGYQWDIELGNDYRQLVKSNAWAHLAGQLKTLREAQVATLAYNGEASTREQAEARATIMVIDSLMRVPALVIEQAADAERDIRLYRS